MKRRLSVAISLIGKPKVVYLDEPSTGLDPASRRNLWRVVQDAKADKGIVLTTHSMEEAEVLCDRLGIFVDGRLICLGNPKQLTARYGGYYVRPRPACSRHEGIRSESRKFRSLPMSHCFSDNATLLLLWHPASASWSMAASAASASPTSSRRAIVLAAMCAAPALLLRYLNADGYALTAGPCLNADGYALTAGPCLNADGYALTAGPCLDVCLQVS